MRIENLEINADMYKILDQLIKDVNKRELNYFALGYKDSRDWLRVQCPYHKGGQESNASAGFSKTDGFFNCFTCKEKHSLTRVISDILGVNGKIWLLDNFDGTATEDRFVNDFSLPKREVEEKKYFSEDVLKQYNKKHPYMYKRKLTDEVIDKFNIGYDPDFTIIKNNREWHFGECITFPIRDEEGHILFIARRAINQKLFHYPEGVEKPLYGLYEIYREMKNGKNIDTIYVCESMINALTLWSWGYYAVALNGTGNKEQIEQLKKLPFREIILALDPDTAGRNGTKNIKRQLSSHKFIKEVVMPEGKDVNDLTYDEFKKLEVKGDFWL